MIESQNDFNPPPTSGLVFRIAVLGCFALIIFAVMFFRLWFLQILSGDQYLVQANNNRMREIKIQAPRGRIVDRNGVVLVDNRVAIAVQIEPRKLPVNPLELLRFQKDQREFRLLRRCIQEDPDLAPKCKAELKLYRQLGKVIGKSAREIERDVYEQLAALPYANVVVKTDASSTVYQYLLERSDEFPAVSVKRVFVRHYPHGKLAAHIFGNVGEISPEELKQDDFAGVRQGTIVGKTGVERAYNSYLGGEDGAARVVVDSMGNPKGELEVKEPVQGKQLKLSLDIRVQKAGEEAVAKEGKGAFVVIDPRNGEVIAMGSNPSFDPSIFTRPVSEDIYKDLWSEDHGAPMLNRAANGVYPPGSTFKPTVAWAALETGSLTPSTSISDGGSFSYGGSTWHNAGGAANGSVDVTSALKVSSDVFFYKQGLALNKSQAIQEYAHKFCFGDSTGIDIGGDSEGLIPDPKWRNELYKKHKTDRPWTPGDNINFSVGQGDIQVSPLQMTCTYEALENYNPKTQKGTIYRPHLGMEVQNSDGSTLQEIKSDVIRRVKLSPGNHKAIATGLRLAASAPGGTSAPIFSGFPKPVHGKTGTAERPPHGDQSWYVAYVPDQNQPVVVAVTVEEGGFGAESAAPAAKAILAAEYGVKDKKPSKDSSKAVE